MVIIGSNTTAPASFISRTMNQLEKVNLNLNGTSNLSHALAFASSLFDNESYTLKEMLKQPDVASFVEAMVEEVAAHEKNEHCEMVQRLVKPFLQSRPSGTNGILMAPSIITKQGCVYMEGCKSGV